MAHRGETTHLPYFSLKFYHLATKDDGVVRCVYFLKEKHGASCRFAVLFYENLPFTDDATAKRSKNRRVDFARFSLKFYRVLTTRRR